MSDSKRSAHFVAEPIPTSPKSGESLQGYGWCVKVVWQDGAVERLFGFASSEKAEAWISNNSDRWLREQSGKT
jgi:hypothetical protein